MTTEAVSTDLIGIYPNQVVRNDETITLRDVDEDSIEFSLLVESIKTPLVDELGRQTSDNGLLNPICVRPYPGHPGQYCIVEGLHRWTAWRKAFGDSKPIPAHVKNLTDDQALLAQIEGNVHRKDTSNIEFSNQMLRYLDHHPEITIDEMASRVHMEPGWLRQILTLASLPKFIQLKLDNKEIPLTVGLTLSRFSKNTPKDPEKRKVLEDTQKRWLDRYEQLRGTPNGTQQWSGEVGNQLKAIRGALRVGKTVDNSHPTGEFVPVFTFRKKSDIEVELKRQDTDVSNSFDDDDRKTAEDFAREYPESAEFLSALGYKKALQWVGQVDPQTTQARREALEKKEAERVSKKEEGKLTAKKETVARSRSMYEMFKK
jgi:ParB/RepB/Spo0J family partition protein